MDESIRNAAATQIGKHRRLLRSARDGRVLSAMMLPLLRVSPATGFGVLTTTGRKTGKPRSKCVRAIRRGDCAYLVALRPPNVAVDNPGAVHAWVWNIRSDPRVRLRIPGGTFDGFAREITDPAELERARTVICETFHALDYAECALHLRGLPARSKIQELHRYWFQTGIPVAIDLKETQA
jgi:deazaflavin-dependent oxidoreductase (nitroreductase family)